MVVAQIAYNHLFPEAKTKCDALIAVSLSYSSAATSNFVTAACWADDFKSSLGTGIWHYIDLQFSLDGTPTSGFIPADFDIVQAINYCISILQPPGSSQTDQATALRYLIHFVGDIQQPLHCSTAISSSRKNGDAGGNSFYINGDWSNLHSLWDAGGGFLTDSVSRPLNTTKQNILNAKVAVIEADYPYDYTTNLNAIPNPMDWAEEGQGLAESVSYVGITMNSTPTASYLNTAMATSEQRMARGGHRLADLLNTLFAPSPVKLTSLQVAGGKFGFSWSAVLGTTYHVQWKQQITDTIWNNLTDVVATNSTTTFTEQFGQAQRFFRVTQ